MQYIVLKENEYVFQIFTSVTNIFAKHFQFQNNLEYPQGAPIQYRMVNLGMSA